MDGTVEKLFISLGFKVDESSKQKVGSEANALKGIFRKALGVIGISLSVAGLKDLASAAADAKAVGAQFNQTFGDLANVAQERLTQVAEYGEMAESRLKSSFTSLAAFAKTGGMEAAESIDFASEAMQIAADSSAYFDRSIEETADIMKRLMKGNFTLDDNLGFQSTQTTRDATAQALFGDKYQNLESWQQQRVILQQIKEANDAMGATGQAKTEAREWTNMIGNMTAYLKELKAAAGKLVLPVALKLVQRITDALKKATEWVNKMVDSLGDFEQEGTAANKIMQTFDRTLDWLERTITRGVTGVRRFVEILGGAGNALKLIGGIIAAIAIQQKLYAFIEGIRKAGSLMTALNFKAIALVATIVLLFLAIDDIVGFMNGKDSMLGRFLDWRGIDPDEVRNNIAGVFEDIQKIADDVKTSLGDVGNFFAEHADTILKVVGAILIVTTVIRTVIKVIGIVKGAIAGVKVAIAGASGAIAGIKGGIAIASGALGSLAAALGIPVAAAGALVAGIIVAVGFIAYYVITHWSEIKEEAANTVAFLKESWQGLKDKISELVEALLEKWEAMKEGAAQAAENVGKKWDEFKTGIAGVVDSIITKVGELAALPEKAFQWGADLFANFKSGLESVGDAVMHPIQTFNNWVDKNDGFSLPEEGPLSHADEWMPDMMNLFASGITNGIPRVKEALAGVSGTIDSAFGGDMNVGVRAMMGNGGDYNRAMGGLVGGMSTSSVVQNNYFQNSFSGTDRQNQVAAAQQMDKNARDTTAYLANALAYGR